jgi:hypothetical protein
LALPFHWHLQLENGIAFQPFSLLDYLTQHPQEGTIFIFGSTLGQGHGLDLAAQTSYTTSTLWDENAELIISQY